jgi:hypothetical protein
MAKSVLYGSSFKRQRRLTAKFSFRAGHLINQQKWEAISVVTTAIITMIVNSVG